MPLQKFARRKTFGVWNRICALPSGIEIGIKFNDFMHERHVGFAERFRNSQEKERSPSPAEGAEL